MLWLPFTTESRFLTVVIKSLTKDLVTPHGTPYARCKSQSSFRKHATSPSIDSVVTKSLRFGLAKNRSNFSSLISQGRIEVFLMVLKMVERSKFVAHLRLIASRKLQAIAYCQLSESK